MIDWSPFDETIKKLKEEGWRIVKLNEMPSKSIVHPTNPNCDYWEPGGIEILEEM